MAGDEPHAGQRGMLEVDVTAAHDVVLPADHGYLFCVLQFDGTQGQTPPVAGPRFAWGAQLKFDVSESLFARAEPDRALSVWLYACPKVRA